MFHRHNKILSDPVVFTNNCDFAVYMQLSDPVLFTDNCDFAVDVQLSSAHLELDIRRRPPQLRRRLMPEMDEKSPAYRAKCNMLRGFF